MYAYTIEKTVKAGEFKAKCLKLMDQVLLTGEGITVTKRGTPIVHITPAKKTRTTLFGAHQDIIEIKGDIMAPIDMPWDAEQ